MKKLIPLLLILAAPLANAAPKPAGQPSLPKTAKLMFQVQGISNVNGGSSDDAALQQAKDNGILRMQQKIEGDEYSAAINVEYQCQGVYRVWGIADVRENQFSTNDGFFSFGGRARTYFSASVTANVYCEPRDFQQKVAISAMQACEKEPKVECMSKEYMEAFSKIQKTAYYDIYKR